MKPGCTNCRMGKCKPHKTNAYTIWSNRYGFRKWWLITKMVANDIVKFLGNLK